MNVTAYGAPDAITDIIEYRTHRTEDGRRATHAVWVDEDGVTCAAPTEHILIEVAS